ncbi:MAG: MBL fold metallo-hydrolase [Acidimicrobiia bacterium]
MTPSRTGDVGIACVRTGASYGDPPYELVTNTWLVGDEHEVVVIDAANDAGLILDAVGGRRVVGVLCTNGTVDHVNAAPAVADATGAPVLLNADDRRMWAGTHPDRAPEGGLVDGQVVTVAGLELRVLCTPGYTRGSVAFHAPGASTVFAGDTLGPVDPAGRHADVRRASIGALLALPAGTLVRPGHGEPATVAEHVRTVD